MSKRELIVRELDRLPEPDLDRLLAFLRSLKGGKWYAELARWATGQKGEEELMKRADTVGQRAEAHFYLGLQRMRAGQAKRGQELFQKVIESEMMAFFEYEMAGYYLRRGVPTQPVLRSAPKPPPKKEPKRPAGSI